MDEKTLKADARLGIAWLVSGTFIVSVVLLLSRFLIYQNRDAAAVDLIKLLAAILGAGFGGYGLGVRRARVGRTSSLTPRISRRSWERINGPWTLEANVHKALRSTMAVPSVRKRDSHPAEGHRACGRDYRVSTPPGGGGGEDPMLEEGRFIALLKCNNGDCEDVVSVAGGSGNEPFADQEGDIQYAESFTPGGSLPRRS